MTLVLPAEQAKASPARIIDAVVPAVLVAVYALAQIALFSTHDAWHDEAHAWLWAKELTGFQFLVIPGEGHPPVWFWILKVLTGFLSFDQARALYVGVAIINAFLLTRLLKAHVVLLFLLLGTNIVLQTWGYYFRPYTLVLTCVVSALLLDRAGRTTAATWALAIACGLHVFSGMLLAFYLVVRLSRGTSIRSLLLPAIVAALFGLSAILSGMGNGETGIDKANHALRFLDALSRPFRFNGIPMWAAALAAIGLVGFGLRKQPLVLATAASLAVAFALFSALIYGASEWHIGFMLMLVVMAFVIAGPTVAKWPLALLLVPQFVLGFAASVVLTRYPERAESEAFAAIVGDAGEQLRTTENLVAWPESVGTAAAAHHEFRYLSGNTGDVISVRDLRTARFRQMDIEFLMTHPGPYWLICSMCEIPVAILEASGRAVEELYAPNPYFYGQVFGAYRVD